MTEHEDDFLEIRNRLFTELVLLTDLWEQYRVLFMSSARQVKRLNEHARWFFATVQRVFLHQIIIGISRITDPAASGRQRNVTLAALLQDPRLRELEAQHAALAAEVETVRAAASPIRRHRNKTIAHLDHAAAFGFDPLPEVHLTQVGEVIELLQNIHRQYGVLVLERDADYDMHAFGSAAQLIETLELAPTRIERSLRQELLDLRKVYDAKAD